MGDTGSLALGVALNNPLVRRVQAKGIPVFSEVEVAYRLCKAPIVAVTGTKGKTTTTALVGALFAAAGKTVHVGGNIGNALIRETAGAAADDWVIAEVSSFQLESIRSFKPRISLILNVTPDHLDRYHSMEEYAEAKFRIFANQGLGDTFVGNLDDPIVVSAPGEDGNRIKTRALWFSDEPHRQSTLYLRNHELIVYAPPAGDPRPVDILPVREIALLGRHNVENVMGAVLVALAGGKSKGTDCAEMGKVLSSRAKAVVLIGDAAEEIAGVVKRAKVELASSMDDAVARARDLAEPGDVILLSPGCASFDMFDSAEHRGETFAAAVHALEKPVVNAR